jgi:hypothetical protein
MTTENHTPDQPDDPTVPGEGREPIDPTHTFDAYFDKPDASETAPDETDQTHATHVMHAADTADAVDVVDSAESEQHPEFEPAHDEPADPDLGSGDPAEHVTEKYSDDSEFTESAFSGTDYTSSGDTRVDYYSSPPATLTGTDYSATGYETGQHQGRSAVETVAPAGFSAPTMVAPVAEPDYPATENTETGPRTARMRTVVLGLVLLVIAGAVLVGQLTSITVNGSAVLLALMIGGGLLLIVGARRS